MGQLIGKRYALALFELAMSENSLDAIEADVTLALATLTSDPSVMQAIAHPQITAGEKLNLLEKAFKGNVSDHLLGLFSVMLKKNRETDIIAVLNRFLAMAADYKRKTVATVRSAVALTDDQKAAITEKLSKNLNKTVTLKEQVDAGLIGGLCIMVDGYIMDNTVKTRLDEIKRQLLDIQLPVS